MRPEERDAAFLWDMRRAAEDALEVSAGVNFETFASTKVLQLALAKAVELVGEAASRLTPAFRAAHPETPWRDVLGMRNRIVHDYWNIDLNIVWEVVQEELPPLIAALDHWLAEYGGDEGEPETT